MKGYVKGKPFIQNGLGAHLCQVAPYEMVICTGLKAIHFVQAIPRGIKIRGIFYFRNIKPTSTVSGEVG